MLDEGVGQESAPAVLAGDEGFSVVGVEGLLVVSFQGGIATVFGST